MKEINAMFWLGKQDDAHYEIQTHDSEDSAKPMSFVDCEKNNYYFWVGKESDHGE